MHFKQFFQALLLLLFVFGCTKRSPLIEETALIPIPSQIQDGTSYFSITSATGMSYDSIFKISPVFFKLFIEEGSSIALKTGNAIRFIQDSTLPKEAYDLQISKVGISVLASTDRGAFYAVQTLRQLLPVSLEDGSCISPELLIRCQSIKDTPQFGYRGMHLDVGRHMYSVDFIKKYIDALALLKMNTFHWHLTEDQGWRIEIKQYPKLQEIAAYRDETLVGHYSDQPHQFDGKPYGGYYTQEEVRSIVAYAQERFVTIIPEIEMPGHSQAAIAAYPELGCSGKQVEVAKKWGVFEEIYCTKDTTFEFLENVLDEVLDLFPSEYIHIGGDEAPKTRWEACENCQERIKREGLKDAHELQNYFITRMESYLNSKGRQIIGWDEILEGGLAPNATVMSWRGTKGAIQAAKAGHKVVTTPTSHCYFDYYQSENEDEPLAIGGFLPLEKVYNFNPIPEELTTDESKYVLGAQGNVWTEYMPTEDQVEYMAFPRMLAMSEVLWTNPKQKEFGGFAKRIEKFHDRLDAMDINYANHLFDIEGIMISNNGESFYRLSTFSEGKMIRVTTDGSEPNMNSEEYESPISVTQSTIIKAAVFKDKEQLSKVFTQNIMYHKAIGAKISIDKKPHMAYAGSGPGGLINGIKGSDKRYGDKEWLGFWGEDIEITINFDEAKDINVIKTRFHNGRSQWIYAPKALDFKFVLDDGSTIKDQINLEELDKLQVDVVYNVIASKERRIKVKSLTVKIPNYGTIPEGNQGAGNKAWTFIDEIIVN